MHGRCPSPVPASAVQASSFNMAKSRQPVVTAGNIALPWPSHQNAANDADISSDQHWSDRLCSDCAICWSSAHWHWPGCSAAASITLVTALTAADTQNPAVQIVNPAAGSSVTGTVSITAVASDNVGVSQVSIYVDGVLKLTSTGTSATYAWNTKKGGRGSHTVTAKAWDTAGNSAVATISVTAR